MTYNSFFVKARHTHTHRARKLLHNIFLQTLFLPPRFILYYNAHCSGVAVVRYVMPLYLCTFAAWTKKKH